MTDSRRRHHELKTKTAFHTTATRACTNMTYTRRTQNNVLQHNSLPRVESSSILIIKQSKKRKRSHKSLNHTTPVTPINKIPLPALQIIKNSVRPPRTPATIAVTRVGTDNLKNSKLLHSTHHLTITQKF